MTRLGAGRVTLSTAVAAGIAAGASGVLLAASWLGSVLLAVAAVVGLVSVIILLRYPWAAATALVVAEASNVQQNLPHGALILYFLAGLATCAILLGIYRGTVRPAWSPVFLFALLYLAARALSLLVATDLTQGGEAIAEATKELVYLVVVTILLSSIRRPGVVKALVSVIGLLAGLSLIQEFVFDNSTTFYGFSQVPFDVDLGGATGRHSGPYGYEDVVGWGQTLVLFLPLALSLWVDRSAGRTRWLFLGVTLSILGGLYLTQSRGAYLALCFAVAVWLVAAGRARLLRFAPLVLLVLLIPGVGSRLATLTAVGEATSGGGGDVSLIERIAVQRDAVAMFTEHPALGVGAGNFLVVQPDYQRESGAVTARPLPVHNTYLQIAAESGMVGLAAWLLFFGCAVFVTVRALIIYRRLKAPAVAEPGQWIAVGVLAGLAGFALAALFVPLTQGRTLMSVIAIGAAVDVQARRAAEATRPAGEYPSRPAPPVAAIAGRIVGAPLVHAGALFVVLLVAGAFLLPLRDQVWVATASAQVVPRVQDRSKANAYEYDLLTRGMTLPTYVRVVAAAVRPDSALSEQPGTLQAGNVRVSVETRPSTAVITVRTWGKDAAQAEKAARDALTDGRAAIAALNDSYVLTPVPAATAVVRQDGPLHVSRAGALLGAAMLAATGYWLLRRRTRAPATPAPAGPTTAVPTSTGSHSAPAGDAPLVGER